MTRSVRYHPILHTLYYTLHTEHAYCLSYRFLNNVVITTVIEMVEMIEILDGRRLALPLRATEMLSQLSKSRISIFNAHLTLFCLKDDVAQFHR